MVVREICSLECQDLVDIQFVLLLDNVDLVVHQVDPSGLLPDSLVDVVQVEERAEGLQRVSFTTVKNHIQVSQVLLLKQLLDHFSKQGRSRIWVERV